MKLFLSRKKRGLTLIWILLAIGGAIFTSLTTIFTKIGIKDVKSNFATFYRTGIVIICCVVMCLITNSLTQIPQLSFQNYLFLGLSGIATGCSWLCYYRALKLGDVNKVAPIDKSSFILTSILFFIFFFDDTTHHGDIRTIVMLSLSMILMLVGTFLMISKQEVESKEGRKWLGYAILSAVFASLVSFLAKLGLRGISSNLGTLFRTIVVFLFALVIVMVKKDYRQDKKITKQSWIFLTLSGIATGGAWLLEYEALNYMGSNPIAVQSIGKLSIVLTMVFSFAILKEKFTKKALLGLLFLIIGIVVTIVFGL